MIVSENVSLIANLINAGTYSKSLTATVSWMPKIENKDDVLQCFVWVDDATFRRVTRCNEHSLEQTVKVAVRDTVGVDVDADVTADINLVEEVIEQLKTTKVLSNRSSIDSISWHTIYDHQSLFEDSLFVSVMSLEVRNIT